MTTETKPADIPRHHIPTDVRLSAEECVIHAGLVASQRVILFGLIARAIMSERERCALLLEDNIHWTFAGSPEAMAIFEDVRELAARAIRGEG